jgi:hypothetical protein
LAVDVKSAGLIAAFRRIRALVIFVALPSILALVRVDDLDDRFDTYGFDFKGTLWEPGRKVLDGVSPYPSATDAASLASGNPSVYPPLPIELASPLAKLGFDASLAIWTCILIVAVVAALWIVGLRDWRCYSLALLCPPVVEGLFLGNLTLFLMLPIAIAWRWRAHAVKAGATVGVAIAIKPVLLPLVGWFVLTRRLRAAAFAATAGILLIVVPWAVIGFDGFREYPRLLDRLEAVYGPASLSPPAALSWLATGQTARQVVCLGAAACLFAIAIVARRSKNGDLAAFSLMVAASVVAIPIVWPHYLALLLVPLAIARQRAGLPWLLPYALALIVSIDDRSLKASCFAMLVLSMALLPALRRAPTDLARGNGVVAPKHGRATGQSTRSLSTSTRWQRL